MAEAYALGVQSRALSSAAIVAGAAFGFYFLANAQLTEGFLAIVVGLVVYSLTHEQRPYFV